MTDSKNDVNRARLRYQSFDLEGQKTAGHDRSYLLDTIFKDSMQGKTLLDIGSYLGYFCVEALKRGAGAATGIEPDLESVQQANSLAQISGVKPNYIHGDFESHDFGDSEYDTVLCLNVLHHMYDSVAAIHKIMRLARERIILEFSAPSIHDASNSSLSAFTWLTNLFPVIVLGDPKKSTDVASRTFVFTAKAMKVLFETQTTAFEPVRIWKSPFKGRLILEARRRNLGHVAFVGGVSSSGKSTVFSRLMRDDEYRKQLGLEMSNPVGVHDGEVSLPNGRHEDVLVHYDILRPYRRSIRSIHRDPRCDLLKVAGEVSFVTIMTAPELLRKQLLNAHNASDPGKLGKRYRHLYDCYSDPSFLRNWYSMWFSYANNYRHKTKGNIVLLRHSNGVETTCEAEHWLENFDRMVKSD